MTPFRIILFFAVLLGFLFLYIHLKKRYATAYKKAVVFGVLRETFPDMRFDPDSGIDSEVIARTEMVGMGTSFSSNDYLSAIYKGVAFEQADVRIVQSSGKSSVTLFYGRWMIFDFNKSFRCDMQVRRRGFLDAKNTGGLFGEKERMQPLKTESLAFNDAFRVYAADQQEAFYILTPHFMERIMRLGNSVDSPLLFCFSGRRLHVACDNREDAFEPSIWEKADYNYAVSQTRQDIRLITDIIDTLSLDTKLYKEI